MSAVILTFAAKRRPRPCIADASALPGRVISIDAPHLRLAMLWRRRIVPPQSLTDFDISREAEGLARDLGIAKARAREVTPSEVVAYYEDFGARPYVTPAGEVKISNVGLAFISPDSETASDRVLRNCMTTLMISDRAFKSALVTFLRETKRTAPAGRSISGNINTGRRS